MGNHDGNNSDDKQTDYSRTTRMAGTSEAAEVRYLRDLVDGCGVPRGSVRSQAAGEASEDGSTPKHSK